MTDKERYATINTWVEVLRKEGADIHANTIRNRLKEAKIIGETARSRTGHLLRNGFYAESEVRHLCADLLQEIPQTDENGLTEKDGQTYGTIYSLSRVLGISQYAITSRIGNSSLKPIQGKDKGGRVCDFYSLPGVRKLCADLLQDIPQAGENGLIEKDGQTYGTIESLSRKLGISTPTITARIQSSSLKPIQGKDSSRHVCDFYSLSEVRKLCAKLLQDLPQADENGLIEKDGQTYGTIESLSRVFGISKSTTRARIGNSSLKPIQGKDKGGRVGDFYPLSQIQKLCADLISKRPTKS